MGDYVERFERDILQECPYRLSESRKCRLFWRGVPFSIKAHADYNFHDYCKLKIEVVRAEREMLRFKRIEENLEEDSEEDNSGVRMGEPVRTTAEDPEENLEPNTDKNAD